MTFFLLWFAGLSVFAALWYFGHFLQADRQREAAEQLARAAMADAQLLQGSLARQTAEAIKWRNRVRVMEKEQQVLMDMLAPPAVAKPSPVSRHTIDELLGETVEEGPETYGV